MRCDRIRALKLLHAHRTLSPSSKWRLTMVLTDVGLMINPEPFRHEGLSLKQWAEKLGCSQDVAKMHIEGERKLKTPKAPQIDIF
jgi:hypothetical protein